MIGSRTKVGTLGDSHLGLDSSDFLVQRCLFFFACREVNSMAIDGEEVDTPAARHIFTCTVTPQNTQHR